MRLFTEAKKALQTLRGALPAQQPWFMTSQEFYMQTFYTMVDVLKFVDGPVFCLASELAVFLSWNHEHRNIIFWYVPSTLKTK